MARNVEQVLQQIIGEYVLTQARLTSSIEVLSERLAISEAALKVSEPKEVRKFPTVIPPIKSDPPEGDVLSER